MLKSVLILLKDSGILLFEEQFVDIDYESQLFTGLLTAVQNFCLEINIGECNVFSSDKYKVVTASTNFVITTLIIEKADPHLDSFWKNLGLDIGKHFEANYDLKDFHGKVSIFSNFKIQLKKILNQNDIFL
ncbi:MAG: hypothetical protein ACTSRG_21320 [Candidatus Helarchaeota archaeon]